MLESASARHSVGIWSYSASHARVRLHASYTCLPPSTAAAAIHLPAGWYLEGQGRYMARNMSDMPLKVPFVPLGDFVTEVGWLGEGAGLCLCGGSGVAGGLCG
jgi:hypothetical protein